jgi:hypothetical protein
MGRQEAYPKFLSHNILKINYALKQPKVIGYHTMSFLLLLYINRVLALVAVDKITRTCVHLS